MQLRTNRLRFLAQCTTVGALAAVGLMAESAKADEVGPWGPIAVLRDDTDFHAGDKPSGGWRVTPIHGVLRARDGKVMLTGTGRIAADSCNGSTQRNYGITFMLDPAELDATADGATLLVQPIDEAASDPDGRHVLYCSGHTTLADGRIFYVGGTDYPRILPLTNPELGLDYARVFDPETDTFTRVEASMKGGPNESPGMKWYPSNRLLPDGRVLIAGGYHWSASGPGDRENRSLEIFDPAIWDADPNADPYTVLSNPGDIPAPINQGGRAYTHIFLLPKPVPAASGGGVARTVALIGNIGEMWLFNHEPGLSGSERMTRMPNSTLPNPSGADKGEGSTSLMLPDGRIMVMSGGRDGQGAANAYFYNPYEDDWDTLDLGIARVFSIATWLPDGTVLLLNGYTSEPGSPWALDNAPGGADGVRRPQIIDPFEMTVQDEAPWPEPTGRGYHSVALLLKDGRVLIGGGKDNIHDTGCEKNEARIYSPPYLSAGPRPEVTNITEGQEMIIGGPPVTIEYSGTVRAERGVALMAPGSITHSYNQGQNYVPLSVVAGPENGSVTVAPPATINQAPPGDYVLHVISEEGAPSVGVHVKLAAPPACTYPLDLGAGVFMEAEGSSRSAGPFTRVDEMGRGNDAYIQVDPAAASATDEPDEGNVMWYDLDVNAEGSVYFWVLGNGPSTDSDTVFVSVNGAADQTVTLEAGAWGWTRAESALALPAGKNTLKVKAGKAGAQLDRIWLTADANGTPPDGLGDAPPDVPCAQGQMLMQPMGGNGGAGAVLGGAGGVGQVGGGGDNAAGGAGTNPDGTMSPMGGSDGGCGCRLAGPESPSKGLGFIALFSALFVAAARRRSRVADWGLHSSVPLGCLVCGLCSACGTRSEQQDAADDAGKNPIAVEAGAKSNDAAAALDAGGIDAGFVSPEPDASHVSRLDAAFSTGLEPTDPYPDSVYPTENPFSAEKALLGKILFWEEQLSSHDAQACGSCHRPSAGGSDPRSAQAESLGAGPNGIVGDEDDARGSLGIARCDSAGDPKSDPIYGLNVQVTPRKAPSALDALFFDELFWDGRAESAFMDPVTQTVAIATGGALESQAAGPPVSDVEMSCEGYGWTNIEVKIAGATPLALASDIPVALSEAIADHPTYPDLFEWVYGTPAVTARRILFAIATYERQLRSDETPWDRFNAGDMDALTAEQQAGLAVFNTKARCAICHVPPLFADNKFHNIGAQLSELDPGRATISGSDTDLGKMKTPSLRNVGLRAAGGLLHHATGSGATLRDVLSAYRQGGIHHENIDPEIQTLNLPDFEFEQLLDFVENGLTDPRVKDELPPFDRPRLGSEQ